MNDIQEQRVIEAKARADSLERRGHNRDSIAFTLREESFSEFAVREALEEIT